MKFKFYIAAILILSFTFSARAQNWPSFRGANASGVADGKTTPTNWDAAKNVNLAWKTAIPGLAHSSPVVWGDKVFITTAISSDAKSEFRAGLYGDVASAADLSKHTWEIYCLDKKSGKILWKRIAREGSPKTKRHTKASFASESPATNGKYVIAFFGSEGLYAYDMNGKLVWKQDLGVLDSGWFFDPDYQWGTASSPIIYKDLVIVQCDVSASKGSFIAAYNLKNGKQVWRTERDEIPSWGTPTIVESKTRVELVTNGTNAVRAYDPLTGKELWQLKGNPEITATTPIAAHDMIYICNGYRPNQPIYAIKQGVANGDISLKDGKETNEFVTWSKQRGGSYMPTPVVYGDYLHVLANQGVLTVYNAKTGERAYQQRVADKGGSFSASPIVANGNLYLASEDGEVHVVKAGAKYELVSTNEIGEVMMATPAVSDGMIFIRGQHHVFAVAVKTTTKTEEKKTSGKSK